MPLINLIFSLDFTDKAQSYLEKSSILLKYGIIESSNTCC